MIKKFIWIVVVVFMFSGLIGCEVESNTDDAVDVSSPSVSEESESVTDEESSDVDDEALSVEVLKSNEDKVLLSMEESFEGFAEISLDRDAKQFNVVPTGEDFPVELGMAINGYEENIESWNVLVDAFVGVSENMIPMLPEYAVAVVNPADETLAWLYIRDGIVLYDVVEENK